MTEKGSRENDMSTKTRKLLSDGFHELWDCIEISLNAFPFMPKLPRRSKLTITKRVYKRQPRTIIHHHHYYNRVMPVRRATI